MANTSYTPRFTAISEGKDMVRLYAVINYTSYIGVESKKKVIRFAVRNLITGKSFKIKKAYWNKKDSRCKIPKGSAIISQECMLANRVITSITKAVSDIVDDYALRKVTFSPSVLTEEKIYETIRKMDEITVTPELGTKKYFTDYWNSWINKAYAGEVRYNGNKYSVGTLRGYKKCLKSLLTYQDKVKHVFTFDEINHDFYVNYMLYLEEECGLIKNTLSDYYNKIKHLMKLSRLEGLHTNLQYENFIATEEEVDNVYLTEDELAKIASLDLEGDALDKYRDMLLVGCYVGLRVSDLLRVRKEHFDIKNGIEMLKIRTKKCPKGVCIPFLWKDLKFRLEKYDYDLPRMAEQNFRKGVKEVCKLAGINSPVIMESGRYKRNEPYEKWQLVSSHTCRRTACTNMVKKGIPIVQVMMISGHKKESTFLKYIKISSEENAIMLSEKYGMS